MKLIKQYEQELEERKTQSKELGEEENSFVDGIIAQLERTIADLKKQALSDRFFLEEAIKRNCKCWHEAEDYTQTLLFDWMGEMIDCVPLTEAEREEHLKNSGWEEDFIEEAYFKTEKELDFFLKNKRLPNEFDFDYSIVDCSTQN